MTNNLINITSNVINKSTYSITEFRNWIVYDRIWRDGNYWDDNAKWND